MSRALKWLFNHPILVVLFISSIDFFGINLLRGIAEHRWYLSPWWAFIYGDSILLPAIGFCEAKALQDSKLRNEPYPNIWWHALLFIIGFLIGNFVTFNGRLGVLLDPSQNMSERYHAFMFWCMFVLLGSPLPLVLKSSKTVWKVLIGVCLFCFLVLVAYDMLLNPGT